MVNQKENHALAPTFPPSWRSQVFISYGALSNSDSLLHYGFIQPNNMYETVGLDMALDPADAHFQHKTELLSKYSSLDSHGGWVVDCLLGALFAA